MACAEPFRRGWRWRVAAPYFRKTPLCGLPFAVGLQRVRPSRSERGCGIKSMRGVKWSLRGIASPCASFLATAPQTRKSQPNWQRAYLDWTTTFGLRIKTYCPETIGPSELEKHWSKPTPWSCWFLPLLRNQNRRVAKCNMPLLLPTTRDGSSPCLCRQSTAFHPTAFPGSSTS
jgi:hypothetical protein